MITVFQNGFVNQWDNKYSMIHSKPIPNELSPNDVMFTHIANAFPHGAKKHIGAHFKDRGGKQTFITINQYNNEVAYFPIEIGDVYQSLLVDNIIGNIKPIIKQMLADPKCNLRLLIWFPTEGFHMNNMNTSKMITDSINIANICNEKVYLVYGDLHCNENVHKHIMPDINWVGMSYFENATVESYNHTPDLLGSINYDEFDSNFLQQKSKYFLYKNRVCRPYRFAAYAMAYKRGLLKHCHHSFIDLFDQVEQSGWSALDDCHEFNKQMIKDLQDTDLLQTIPKILDAGKKEVELTQWSTTKHYQQDSHISIVTETVVEPGLLFLSEKTWKCILNYHPFIIWGNPGILEYLKSIGYKTFDEFWDESYDKEYNTYNRLVKIMNLLEYIASGNIDDILYSKELKDVLVHNHNLIKARVNTEYERVHHYLTTHNQ
jgi:hypothetical protein